MNAPLDKYLDLIPSENASQPNFVAVLSALLQGPADIVQTLNTIPTLFDIDVAAGQQLDFTGQWIGASRTLSIPLTGVYFSFDTTGVGFDQGTWLGPFDPTTQLDVLPDSYYRQLLYAKIANNQWQGNVPSAYEFMEAVFPGNTFFIQDLQNMEMLIGVIDSVPLTAVTTALLENGYFNIKPVGVRVIGYVIPSVPGDPIFGFNADNATIGGFDHGAWATISGGL